MELEKLYGYFNQAILIRLSLSSFQIFSYALKCMLYILKKGAAIQMAYSKTPLLFYAYTTDLKAIV